MTHEQRQRAENWLRDWTGVKGCYGHCRSHLPNSDWSCAWCTFHTLLSDLTGSTLPAEGDSSRSAPEVTPHAHTD